MSARLLPIACLLAFASPAFADNHGDDIPYCGDTDSIAEPSPVCIAWDGDTPAEPDRGPWKPCPAHLRQFPGMNCIVLQPDEHLFGEGEAVAIRPAIRHEPETIEVRCDTLFCDGGTPEPWTSAWWHRGNHDRDDADRSGRAQDRTEVARAEPQPAEPPARETERSEPPEPAPSEEPECD